METIFDKALEVAREKYPYRINSYEEYRDYFVFEHDDAFASESETWRKYEEELYAKVLTVQNAAGDEYDIDRGLVAAVVPFMKRNGYANSGGSWVKRDC